MKIRAEASDSLPKNFISGTTIFAGAILIALSVSVDFWLSTWDSNERFIDWLKDDWLVVSIRSAVILGGIWWVLGTRQTVWDAMYADYSTAPAFRLESDSYPTVSGIMKVDEEEFEISTTPTEAGLVLSRPSGESLFFSWMKVKEIRVKNKSGSLALVQIRRRTKIPLELEVPWDPAFRDDLAEDVQYHFSPAQLDSAIEELASRAK